MPKNKQKKIVCVNCKEHYDPQRYNSCPTCSQVGILAVLGKKPSHTPQGYDKYEDMGLLKRPDPIKPRRRG